MKILIDMVLGILAGGAGCLAFFGLTAFIVETTDKVKYRHLNYKPNYSFVSKKNKVQN